MFQHGSVHEVVDNEKEPCGCPPAPHPGTNEFPLAQSAGLAPLPKPAPGVPMNSSAPTQVVEPLIYKSVDHVAQPGTEAAPPTSTPKPAKPAKKKQGRFGGLGRFFRRLFGAE
jgi:hypothetical protein